MATISNVVRDFRVNPRKWSDMLTRKMLEAMGVEEKALEQIIEAHGETVTALKNERDGYKAEAESIKAQMDQVKSELATAQANTDGNANYKELYESEREAFATYKADVEADRSKAQRETLYRELLRMNGVDPKRHDAILRVTDLSGLEVDDNGALANANELSETIKSDWADFVVSTTTQGAIPDNPPASHGGKTVAEIMSIKDPIQRQTEIAQNIELFS